MRASEIRRLRLDLGLTQVQLATLLDAHSVTVSRWENAHCTPSLYQQALLQRLQEAASNPTVKEQLGTVLLDADVPAALYLVLKAAFAGDEFSPRRSR